MIVSIGPWWLTCHGVGLRQRLYGSTVGCLMGQELGLSARLTYESWSLHTADRKELDDASFRKSRLCCYHCKHVHLLKDRLTRQLRRRFDSSHWAVIKNQAATPQHHIQPAKQILSVCGSPEPRRPNRQLRHANTARIGGWFVYSLKVP